MLQKSESLCPFDAGRVVFRNRDIPIVGNVWVPTTVATERGHPAIVLVTPAPCLKEGVGADYASYLAKAGCVALTFDPSHQGESRDRLRDTEYHATRVEDVSCAIGFLSKLPFVDAERVSVFGIGAGGDYAEQAARADERVQAVCVVLPDNIDYASEQLERQVCQVLGQHRSTQRRRPCGRDDERQPVEGIGELAHRYRTEATLPAGAPASRFRPSGESTASMSFRRRSATGAKGAGDVRFTLRGDRIERHDIS